MEVRYSGTVTTPPRFFYGSGDSHMDHEQFDVRRDPEAGGGTFRVIDNVSIGPRVPVNRAIALRRRASSAIMASRQARAHVHFTHHDPWGTPRRRFRSELGGRVYASAASAPWERVKPGALESLSAPAGSRFPSPVD